MRGGKWGPAQVEERDSLCKFFIHFLYISSTSSINFE